MSDSRGIEQGVGNYVGQYENLLFTGVGSGGVDLRNGRAFPVYGRINGERVEKFEVAAVTDRIVVVTAEGGHSQQDAAGLRVCEDGTILAVVADGVSNPKEGDSLLAAKAAVRGFLHGPTDLRSCLIKAGLEVSRTLGAGETTITGLRVFPNGVVEIGRNAGDNFAIIFVKLTNKDGKEWVLPVVVAREITGSATRYLGSDGENRESMSMVMLTNTAVVDVAAYGDDKKKIEGRTRIERYDPKELAEAAKKSFGAERAGVVGVMICTDGALPPDRTYCMATVEEGGGFRITTRQSPKEMWERLKMMDIGEDEIARLTYAEAERLLGEPLFLWRLKPENFQRDQAFQLGRKIVAGAYPKGVGGTDNATAVVVLLPD